MQISTVWLQHFFALHNTYRHAIPQDLPFARILCHTKTYSVRAYTMRRVHATSALIHSSAAPATTVISSSFFQWSDRITSLSQRQRTLVKRIQSRYITHTQTLVQRAPKLGFQLQTNNHNCKMLKVSKSVCFVIHTR